MSDDFDKTFEHQHGKRQEVQSGQRLRQPLIVARQTPEACCPSETALDDPTTWQQHESFFRFREFDYFQTDAVRPGILRRSFTRIALINKRHFDRLARHLLHGLRQLSNLRAVLLVGWRDQQGKQIAKRVNGDVRLATLAALRSIIRGACARLPVWIAVCANQKW